MTSATKNVNAPGDVFRADFNKEVVKPAEPNAHNQRRDIKNQRLMVEIIDIEQQVGRCRGKSHIEDTRILKKLIFEGFTGIF